MYCSKCGNKIDDDARFCDRCGAPIDEPIEAPAEEQVNETVEEPDQESPSSDVTEVELQEQVTTVTSNIGKKSRLPVLIGIGVTLVALAVVLIFVFVNPFASKEDGEGVGASDPNAETQSGAEGSDTSSSSEETDDTIVVGVDVLDYEDHSFACFFGCASWEEASGQCENMGGHLAVITSQEENDALFAFTRYCGYDNVYIGYSDSEEEGNWQWVNGEESGFTNWNEGEPNAFTENEDYAVITDTGTWYDGEYAPRIENGLIAFICEWDEHVVGSNNVSYEDILSNVGETEQINTLEMNRAAAYSSYLQILEDNSAGIIACERFNHMDCAFADVTGDGVEDLIITTVGEYNGCSNILVFSYNQSSGVTNQILTVEGFNWEGGAGTTGMIAVSDEGDLITCEEGGGSGTYDYYRYKVYSFDGYSLALQETLYYELYDAAFDSADPEPDLEYIYMVNDGYSTEAQFNYHESAIINSMSVLLQYLDPAISNVYPPYFHDLLFSRISSMTSVAMTYDDMHAYLTEIINNS